MKKVLFSSLVLSGMVAYAQTGNVGINNDNPQATLQIDVAKVNKDENTNEGIIIPKLTKERVAKIDDTNLVKGTLVFVEGTTYGGSNTKVSQITSDGFYHYDGANWVKGVATDNDTTYTGSTSISITDNEIQRAALTGDVTATANDNATTLSKIQGKNLDLTNLQANEVLTYNGTNWTSGRTVLYFAGFFGDIYYKSAIEFFDTLNAFKCNVWRTDEGYLYYVNDDELLYYGFDGARLINGDVKYTYIFNKYDDGAVWSNYLYTFDYANTRRYIYTSVLECVVSR